MTAMLIIGLAMAALGKVLLKISGLIDKSEGRSVATSHWYDNVFMLLMITGMLMAVGFSIALAWKFLP